MSLHIYTPFFRVLVIDPKTMDQHGPCYEGPIFTKRADAEKLAGHIKSECGFQCFIVTMLGDEVR